MKCVNKARIQRLMAILEYPHVRKDTKMRTKIEELLCKEVFKDGDVS